MPLDSSTHWQRSRSSQGPDLKIFQVRFDWMCNPRNGHEEKITLLEGGDSVQIIAISEDQHLLLVQQYRFGIEKQTYELPGGLIDAGETPLEAAMRELREETGHTGKGWQNLGRQAADPVCRNAYVHHFLVREPAPVSAQVLDAGEMIKLHWLDQTVVKDMLLAGDFAHPHSVCGLLAFFAAEGMIR